MSIYNQTNNVYVHPVPQVSPSGMNITPRLEDITDKWGNTTTNAKWVDPSSGMIFKQGIVSVKTRDGKTFDINSPQGRSR